MNVSITEDATMSLTRSEGGAKVVRVDAIAIVPAQETAFFDCGSETITRTAMSLCPYQDRVNGQQQVM
jgi:hypothetical protein